MRETFAPLLIFLSPGAAAVAMMGADQGKARPSGMSLPSAFSGSMEGCRQVSGMAESSSRGQEQSRITSTGFPREPRAELSHAIGSEGLSKAEGCASTCCFSLIRDGEEDGRKKPNPTQLVDGGRIFSLHVLSSVQDGTVMLRSCKGRKMCYTLSIQCDPEQSLLLQGLVLSFPGYREGDA